MRQDMWQGPCFRQTLLVAVVSEMEWTGEEWRRRGECCTSPGSEQMLLERKEPDNTESSVFSETGLGN